MPYLSGRAKKYYKYNIDLNLLCVARNVTGYAHEVMGKTYVGIQILRSQNDILQHMVQDEQRLLRARNKPLARGYSNSWPIVFFAQLTKRTEDDLEDCGPLDTELPERIPPETETPIPTSAFAPLPTPTTVLNPTGTSTSIESLNHRSLHPSLSRRFLYNTTIGEEYVNCTETSNSTDRAHGIRHVYEFDQPVLPQCGTVDHFGPHTDNYTIMLFTTDFCC